MADQSAVYTLTTPATTIVFNNGDLRSFTDLYWIQTIQGLNMPQIRAPIDPKPLDDGGLIHDFFFAERHVVIDGFIIVQSVGENECQAIFSEMEDDLEDALTSILAGVGNGTLAWTPANGGARSITVNCDVGFDPQPTDNYRLRTFNFGLVSASPVIVGST